MVDKGHTLYMKVSLALHVGRVVQLYTIHQICFAFHVGCVVHPYTIHGNLPRLEVVFIAHGRKGTRTTQETWLTFHVGCTEGMAEKGHTIHENLACFTCWMYSRASNTLYIETWLALHVECVVQLYTLHKIHVCFTCWVYSAATHFT